MLAFVAFVVGVLVVAGLIFLGASLLLGRGESRPPAEPDRSPVELPADRAVTGDDVRALQIAVTVRGYRMAEVDWLLEQFAAALDERDAEIAGLRARVQPHPGPGAGAKDGQGPAPADDGDGRTTDDEEPPRA